MPGIVAWYRMTIHTPFGPRIEQFPVGRRTGNHPRTGLEEINGDLPGDFCGVIVTKALTLLRFWYGADSSAG